MRGEKETVSLLEGQGEKGKDSRRTQDSAKMPLLEARRQLSMNDEKSKLCPHERAQHSRFTVSRQGDKD